MHRINLHAHTHNSDGRNTLLEMCEKAAELGFSALVITDHDDVSNFSFHRNEAELDVLKRMKILPIPVIIGCEILTPFGEYLLFGRKPIKRWMKDREKFHELSKSFDANLFVHLFKTYVLRKNRYDILCGVTHISSTIPSPYALIKCHPDQTGDNIRSIPKEWWDLVHGFEIQNGLTDYGAMTDEGTIDTITAYREVMPWAKSFRNSDAHTVDCLSNCWNETGKKITDEGQLIQWIISGRKRYEETRPYTPSP